MDSDFLLIQRMKNGDGSAVDTFVEKYYPMILRYCTLHVWDAGDAEDITQETFERFFRTFGQYRHYGKAANYLYVIAANACKDHYRKNSPLPVEELPEPMDSGMDLVDVQLDVHEALNRLPTECKEAAILFFFQGLRQKEIAKILNIGLPLVKYRIKRAKTLLAEYLRQEETDEVIGEVVE